MDSSPSKTSKPFHMKKFRDKLKEADFIKGTYSNFIFLF